MEKRITRFNVHKTALTTAALMAIVTVPFLLLMAIPALFSGEFAFLIMAVLSPIFYLIFGYIFAAFWCWVYNIVVAKTKLGIVISLEDPL